LDGGGDIIPEGDVVREPLVYDRDNILFHFLRFQQLQLLLILNFVDVAFETLELINQDVVFALSGHVLHHN
jgi:hypothetical protein